MSETANRAQRASTKGPYIRTPFDPVGDPEAASRVAALALEETQSAEGRGEIPDGDYLFADVFVTMSVEAKSLPQDVFDGPRDSRWEFDQPTSTYVEVRTPGA